ISLPYLHNLHIFHHYLTAKNTAQSTSPSFPQAQLRSLCHRRSRSSIEEGLVPVLNHAALNNQVHVGRHLMLTTGFHLASLRDGFPESPLLDAMVDIFEAVFCRHILPERVSKIQRWLEIGKEKKFAKACGVLNRILESYVSNKYQFYIANKKSTEEGEDEEAYLGFNIMTLFFVRGSGMDLVVMGWIKWRRPRGESEAASRYYEEALGCEVTRRVM
ncbi:cytochrome P450 family protein, partial [Striga asiatica]